MRGVLSEAPVRGSRPATAQARAPQLCANGRPQCEIPSLSLEHDKSASWQR